MSVYNQTSLAVARGLGYTPASVPVSQLPQVGEATPTWKIQLALESVVAHVFTIGSSTLGGSDVIGGGLTPTFQDVTADVMSFSVKRGRNANLDAVMQGTASFVLSDPNGKYNPQGGYYNAVLADQPRLYLRLDEVSGSTTAQDMSSFGNSGTYNGTVTYQVASALADGDLAATFDGVTGYVSGTLNPAQVSTFTYEGWYSTKSIGSNNIFSTGQADHVFGVLSGHLQASVLSGTTVIDPTATNDGNWHHAAVTYDGTTLRLYRDGQLVSSTTSANTGYGSTTYAAGALGSNTALCRFNGSIDEIAYYPFVLSATRIAAHYTASAYYGSGVQPLLPMKASATFYDYQTTVLNDAPTAWYRFTDSIMSTVAVDSSGAGNTGTLHGGVSLQQQGVIVDSSPAALFDGVLSYVSVPWSGNLGFSSAFTAEVWINLSTLKTGCVATQRVSDTDQWSLSVLPVASSLYALRFQVISGGQVSQVYSGSLAVGTWLHVMAVYGGSQVKLFVNGVQYGPVPAPATMALTGSTILIGADFANNTFSGLIDEFSLYPAALSSTRVLAHMNSGIGAGGDSRDFGMFYGFVDRAEFDPDPANQSTTITCVDLFEQLNIVTPTIATQYNQRMDQLVSTILTRVPITDPTFINLGVGPDNIVAWGDAVTGSNTALTLFQNLLLSDQGIIYINGSGQITYKNRSARYSIPSPLAIWDGAIIGPGSKPSADKRLIFNYESATRQFSQQVLSLSGAPTGGTFTLELDGQTTTALNWNATAGQVQSALQALSNVGTNGVLCTDGPLNAAQGNQITCNFIGYRVSMTLASNSLTGGTSPTVTISNSIVDSTAQIAQDVASQKQYGLRAFSGVGGTDASDASTNWNSDSQANSFANFIVLVNKASRPPLRTATVTNGPSVTGINEAAKRLWQLLARDLTDNVTINLTSAKYGGGSFSQGSIQSIDISASQGGRIVTGQYNIQPTAPTVLGGIFTVGVSKLNGSDVLGY